MTKNLLVMLLLSGCDGAFVPAFEGEPECGAAQTIHAVVGEACVRDTALACDCEERRELECASGVWSVRRWGCSGGVSAAVD